MRTLRIGSIGEDVKLWKNYLCGQSLFSGDVDTEFDQATSDATKQFQLKYGLDADGEAGPNTLGTALLHGYGGMADDSNDEDGPNWPMHPIGLAPMSEDQKKAAFGAFRYTPIGTPQNPEEIQVLDGWYSQHIVPVEIPQIHGLLGTSGLTKFPFHKAAQTQFAGVFQAWEKTGLINLVKSWGGSYAARFIRGSTSILSNHSYGSAFDINVPWNPLGATPALKNKEGSVRELVAIANQLGFYWGGHFQRLDGMHFEICTLMPDDAVSTVLNSIG
ncbi:MAG TPA: M15 family metallopeptidase [Methylobacter sp.]|jgi:hypothetical protein